MLVVGAANSACDVALETYYKGAEVTMCIREDAIYDKVKYWIRPNIENRIEITSTQKDEFGMPFGRIVHSYDQDAIALWNANFDVGLAIAKTAGAKEVWSGRGNQPTIHMHGGTIMGTGAADSVVNSYGQTHEIPNLWVAGPGIFPTEGASNPTYTIFALSMRGAEKLTASWGAVAG